MDLRLQDLHKEFNGHIVLNNVKLEIQNISALVLIGPSGGGKSTLLRMIAGLEQPNKGRIELNGERVPFGQEEAMRAYRAQTGFVFQAHNLFPHLTALRNITLPLEKVHSVPPPAAQDQALQWLRRFRLEAHANKYPAQLSGGQQQRVAIARAVAFRPRLLVFDEPTSALDPVMTAEVLDMIAELRSEGRDLILATHEMGFARRVADQVAFVGDESIAAHGSPAEMIDTPRDPRVREFLERVLRY